MLPQKILAFFPRPFIQSTIFFFINFLQTYAIFQVRCVFDNENCHADQTRWHEACDCLEVIFLEKLSHMEKICIQSK